jgi:hypothetical protein
MTEPKLAAQLVVNQSDHFLRLFYFLGESPCELYLSSYAHILLPEGAHSIHTRTRGCKFSVEEVYLDPDAVDDIETDRRTIEKFKMLCGLV